MALITSLLTGLIFGLGLIISGMTNPAKVLGFLDVAGQWDPSLALVMVGAIAVAYFAFRSAASKTSSLLGLPVQIPKKSKIDLRLILGSLVFGVGWGLAGYCPGPGVASLATGYIEPVLFTAAMLVGMVIFALIEGSLSKDRTQSN